MATDLLTSFSNQLADSVSAASHSVVQVQGRRRPASGLVYADNGVLTRCARSAAKTGSTYAETMGAHSMQLAGRDQAVRREQSARAAAACGVDLDDRRPHRVDGLDDRLRIRIKQHAIVWLRQHTTIVGGPTDRAHDPNGEVTDDRTQSASLLPR